MIPFTYPLDFSILSLSFEVLGLWSIVNSIHVTSPILGVISVFFILNKIALESPTLEQYTLFYNNRTDVSVVPLRRVLKL